MKLGQQCKTRTCAPCRIELVPQRCYRFQTPTGISAHPPSYPAWKHEYAPPPPVHPTRSLVAQKKGWSYHCSLLVRKTLSPFTRFPSLLLRHQSPRKVGNPLRDAGLGLKDTVSVLESLVQGFAKACPPDSEAGETEMVDAWRRYLHDSLCCLFSPCHTGGKMVHQLFPPVVLVCRRMYCMLVIVPTTDL